MALGREDDHYAGSTTGLPYSYVPIPNGQTEDHRRILGGGRRNNIHDDEMEDGEKQNRARFAFALLSMVMLAAFVVAVVGINHKSDGGVKILPNNVDVGDGHEGTLGLVMSRGKGDGVSEKMNRVRVGNGHHRLGAWVFDWKKSVLDWQRTGFHFQPKNNWMNDPNGPLLYKGWYHLFYQYNPNGAVWGDIVWGHAASRDLINWLHLPIAMVPDKWSDEKGVWTGSATIIPSSTESSDERVVMLYTGSTNESVQVQNLAVPADESDPLLIKWVKYPGNPVLFPPKGIDKLDFRDPTTAWLTKEGKWRISIGSKRNRTGISLMYDTKDFIDFEFLKEDMHGVEGTGMWECVDFYPVSVKETNGVDMMLSDDVKHVLKASMDDDRNDYYSLGSYEDKTGKWVPDNAGIDVGIGLRYDYGKFYASKTFYDAEKKRRVLWGWVPEGDSEYADVQKGWSSLQGIPRTVLYDQKTGENLITWPVEEVESLRSSSKEFKNVKVEAGTVVPLELGNGNDNGDASQIDIVAEFEIDYDEEQEQQQEEEYRCDTSGGAAQRGAIGPFGFLVLTDEEQTEQTPVYFYLQKKKDGGGLNTFICTDLSRSSAALDVTKDIYGSTVPVLTGEKLSLRILVDHSIVEAFAQEGRTSITSRVYPTKAVYQHAKLFLFNNATHVSVTASVKAWRMTPARYAQGF